LHSQFEIIGDYWVALIQNEPIWWHVLFLSANFLSATCASCCRALAGRACLVLPRLAASVLYLPLFPHQLLSANLTLLCELLPSLLSPSAMVFSCAQCHCPVVPFPQPCPGLVLSLQALGRYLRNYFFPWNNAFHDNLCLLQQDLNIHEEVKYLCVINGIHT